MMKCNPPPPTTIRNLDKPELKKNTSSSINTYRKPINWHTKYIHLRVSYMDSYSKHNVVHISNRSKIFKYSFINILPPPYH